MPVLALKTNIGYVPHSELFSSLLQVLENTSVFPSAVVLCRSYRGSCCCTDTKETTSEVKLSLESHLLGRQRRHRTEEHLPLRTSHIALKFYRKWLISCHGFS